MSDLGIRSNSASRYRITVCHPELLLGQAVSAALAGLGFDVSPGVVTSSQKLLARAGAGFDLAVVSEAIGDELGELLEALAHRDADLPVLVLCRRYDFAAAARVLELGAVGSVSSDSPLDVLAAGVTAACEGQVVFLDDAADEVRHALDERRAERGAADAVYRSLTERERTIVTALADGRAAGEIARSLSLSPHTIRAAIRAVGEKLDARGQLLIAAAARELLRAVSPPSPRFVRLQQSWRDGPRAG